MAAAALQTKIELLQQQVALLQEALAQARGENTLLRQKLDALARRMFGKKSEQLDAAQLQLLLAGLTPPMVATASPKSLLPVAAPRHARKTPQRIITPESLEVVREVIEPAEIQTQPEHWKRIAEEVSRQLDFQPAKFFWRETVRPKYVRADDRSLPPVVAPAPVRVADRCLAAPGLLAHLLVSKYADHQPFYRLQMMCWQRQGVFIARQRMVLWVGQCGVPLEAIVIVLKQELQQSP
jgi:transposase